METKLVSIDLAKKVFHLSVRDKHGKTLRKLRLRRSEMHSFFATLSPCVVAMEACGSAHYWARSLRGYGHDVKLIAAHFVKPFVKSNKNDRNDAEAIAEAASRPEMRYVAIKEVWQQEVRSLHKIRQRRVKAKVALMQELHGLLLEFGYALPKGYRSLIAAVAEITSPDHITEFSDAFKGVLVEMIDELKDIQARILKMDKQIAQVVKERPICQELMKLDGVGVLTATAFVATIGDPHVFKNGRMCSAYLGLVPRQHSTGGKHQLLGISKRGDVYLRTLLIHGARSVLYYSRSTSESEVRRWASKKEAERGTGKAIVAVANKTARRMWRVMQEAA